MGISILSYLKGYQIELKAANKKNDFYNFTTVCPRLGSAAHPLLEHMPELTGKGKHFISTYLS